MFDKITFAKYSNMCCAKLYSLQSFSFTVLHVSAVYNHTLILIFLVQWIRFNAI